MKKLLITILELLKEKPSKLTLSVLTIGVLLFMSTIYIWQETKHHMTICFVYAASLFLTAAFMYVPMSRSIHTLKKNGKRKSILSALNVAALGQLVVTLYILNEGKDLILNPQNFRTIILLSWISSAAIGLFASCYIIIVNKMILWLRGKYEFGRFHSKLFL